MENISDKKYIVYCHRNKLDGKRYIGMTGTTIENRWKSGYRRLYFGEVIKKVGKDNFDHYVLFENLTKSQAKIKERQFIDYYKTYEKEHGYNVDSGSWEINIKIRSEESKQQKIINSLNEKIRYLEYKLYNTI